MLCKKLIFETGSKNAGKGLRLRSSVSVKKKENQRLPLKEFVDCVLQDLPQDPTKKTREKASIGCQNRRKENQGSG